MNKSINVIAAIDKNYGIGKNNTLPWHIPPELALFKEKTKDSILIVGRVTSIGLPVLKGRRLFVVSRSLKPMTAMGYISIFSSFEDDYTKAEEFDKKIFVIGGGQLFDHVISKYKDRITLHLSMIANVYDCDISFNRNLLNDMYIVEKPLIDPYFTHWVMKSQKHGERQYIDLVKEISANGDLRETRNGLTRSLFSKYMRFNLVDGFPLLTTRKVFFRGIVEELLWFLRGQTDSKILEAKGVNIWRPNTTREFLDEHGFVDRREGLTGKMYGANWRNFAGKYDSETGQSNGGIDQIAHVIESLKTDPSSRRHVITTLDVACVSEGVLWPCHSIAIQFYVTGEFIDMFCFNRSSDVALGLPFNIASSALLLEIIAKLTGYTPRYLNISLGDAHVYDEHLDVLLETTENMPYVFPRVKIPELTSLSDLDESNGLTSADFTLENYLHYPSVKMSMKA
jgi:dihydrofolate reductase/thymidylate synthase